MSSWRTGQWIAAVIFALGGVSLFSVLFDVVVLESLRKVGAFGDVGLSWAERRDRYRCFDREKEAMCEDCLAKCKAARAAREVAREAASRVPKERKY